MIVTTELAFAFMLARIVCLDMWGRGLNLSDALVIVSIIGFHCYLLIMKMKQDKLQILCDQISELKNSQEEMKEKFASYDELHEQLSKQSEEVKKMISNHNLSNAFTQKKHML